MEIALTDDGYVVELHQSWLSDFLLCPERARQSYQGISPRTDSDSSAVGTATHAAIEYILHGTSRTEAIMLAFEAFNAIAAGEGFVWDKVKTHATAHRDIQGCVDTWLERVYPTLGSPLGIEEHFRLLFMELELADGTPVQVYLAGTMDYIDELAVHDWKTTGNLSLYSLNYNDGGKGLEKKRWGIQPTVYGWAAHVLGYMDVPVPFTYHALSRGAHPDYLSLTVERGPDDWQRLRALVRNAVSQHFSNLERWPMSNASFLCSATYCDAWRTCPMGDLNAVQTPEQPVMLVK